MILSVFESFVSRNLTTNCLAGQQEDKKKPIDRSLWALQGRTLQEQSFLSKQGLRLHSTRLLKSETYTFYFVKTEQFLFAFFPSFAWLLQIVSALWISFLLPFTHAPSYCCGAGMLNEC